MCLCLLYRVVPSVPDRLCTSFGDQQDGPALQAICICLSVVCFAQLQPGCAAAVFVVIRSQRLKLPCLSTKASAGLCCCCFCGFKPVWWCYSPADLGASACVSMYCAETCAALNVHGCMRCNGVLEVMQSMSCAQVAKPVCCRLPPDPCGWGPLERCPV